MEDEPPRTFPRIASMRPIVEIWLGIGMKAPVVQEILVHLAHAERNRDWASTQLAEPAPTIA
jgi:hypothetical protein